jgi:hypothetical protein
MSEIACLRQLACIQNRNFARLDAALTVLALSCVRTSRTENKQLQK